VYTQPLKMELIQGSETSANYNLTPGKYPKDNIQYSNHGESLKSRKLTTFCNLLSYKHPSLIVSLISVFFPISPSNISVLVLQSKMRKFHIHRNVQGEFNSDGLSDGKLRWFIYRRRENSSSTGEKSIICAPLKLGGTKIGLRIVTQIIFREIKSHKIPCRTWNFCNRLSRQFWRRMFKTCC